jgi:hypothetical protein
MKGIYFELTTLEAPGQLEFHVERKLGSAFRVLYPAIWAVLGVLCALVFFTSEYPPDWSAGLGIGSVIGLVTYPLLLWLGLQNRFTRLTVTAGRFSATGRGVGSSPWRAATLNVAASQVEWIGYLPGYAPGVYISQGLLNSSCVLPGLDRLQAASVTAAIARRFPELSAKTKSQP